MWIVTTLISLAVLIVLALSVPLDVALHMDAHGRPKFSMRLVWLFGLVSKEVRPEEKKRVIKGRRGLGERVRQARAMFEILRIKGLLRQLKSLLKGMFSCIEIREIGANLRVGLDNPADTALLFAFIGPATLFLESSFPYQLRVQPSFDDEAVFDGYLDGAARLRPIKLVRPLLGFTFSSATIRALKILVLTKWKRKK